MADTLEAVIVNADYLTDKALTKVKYSSTCSGILLSSNYGLVLTTGAVLSPHRIAKQGLVSNISSRISRLMGYDDNDNQLQKITASIQAKFSVLLEKKSGDERKRIHECNAKLLGGCFSKSLDGELKNLMKNSSWTPLDRITTQDVDKQLKMKMAFILFQIRDNTYPVTNEIDVDSSQLSHITYRLLNECWTFVKQAKKGEKIFCESSLFGELSPDVFMNSISQGIVVNKQGAMMLTDARCAPGSEGGLVFINQNNRRFWVGMIMASLCWKQRDLLGLALVCSADYIILEFMRQLKCPILPSISTGVHQSVWSDALSSIVVVRNGPAWGSGIIIDKSQRIILTCSHVVRRAATAIVEVHCPEIRSFQAQILYQTPEDEVPDIAVLQIEAKTQLYHEIKLIDHAKLTIGDDVLAAGFAIFPPSSKLGVNLTSGVISKVIYSNRCPIMMQTSCSVFGGASGGLILSASSGIPLGIIVCNAKDSKRNITYPCINLAIPLASLYSVIQKFLNTGDKSVLQQLQVNNNDVTTVWKLGKLPSGPDSKL